MCKGLVERVFQCLLRRGGAYGELFRPWAIHILKSSKYKIFQSLPPLHSANKTAQYCLLQSSSSVNRLPFSPNFYIPPPFCASHDGPRGVQLPQPCSCSTLCCLAGTFCKSPPPPPKITRHMLGWCVM